MPDSKPLGTVFSTVGLLIGMLGLQSIVTATPDEAVPSPASVATPPTPSRLMTRCYRAMGGETALEKIESLSLEATVTIDTEPIAHLEMQFAQGGKSLVRFTITETDQAGVETKSTTSFGSDGTTSWEQLESGSSRYRLINPEELADRVAANNWLGRILHLGAEATDMETMGETIYMNSPCWQVRVTTKHDEFFIYLDTETRFISGFRFPGQVTPDQDTPQPYMDVIFRDWKPVESINLFHEVRLQQDSTSLTITYDAIELNKVPAATFQLPAEVKSLLPPPVAEPDQEDE